jgi:hypothetical protein
MGHGRAGDANVGAKQAVDADHGVGGTAVLSVATVVHPGRTGTVFRLTTCAIRACSVP